MRVLVTGASGFVGRHLARALEGDGQVVVAAGGPSAVPPYLRLDILDAAQTAAVVAEARPDAVVHLAGQAFVPAALADPLGTLELNVLGTARVLEAVRAHHDAMGTNPRVLVVSSAEVYGAQRPERMPCDESARLRPLDPYAASKAAVESCAAAWSHAFGLDVVVARPFNHIGPGQDERFVVAAFARRLAAVAAGAERVMRVGNLEAERDFLDVRDVAAAYVALLANGRSGDVYNVCSGRAVAIRTILRQLITIAHVPVEVREDPELMRSSDVPVLVGDAAKLRAATGWEPRYTLDASLHDVYADARERLAAVRA